MTTSTDWQKRRREVRTSGRKHFFTVRCLNNEGKYIAHREHIVGIVGVDAFKKEVAEKRSECHVAYIRIFNETAQNTRYEGCSKAKWTEMYMKFEEHAS